ncbi:accessory factor UbiK family protein [Candidatus Palibaumannia cicadellinicola]|uniref:Ubiquinone biosynthesis accessory factor UbiK n=1 Tax=Candidatus Palibaumannia cicadellinicola TaxID=186490 RepID=A0A0K2BM69_9GAMM|nr:accessory factor UbiK family protein [Candidatus Baumannia cicadellinicola]AKZ66143.1 hypothetical protein AB162_566 [Candidatus Baumannia cicadellinicola]
MINKKKIEEMIIKVNTVLPKSIRKLGDNIEQKIRNQLQNQFSRMNLVSYDKFDVQTEVLLRTREELSKLELRLKELELLLKK